MADGGEGTLDAFATAVPGARARRRHASSDPTGRRSRRLAPASRHRRAPGAPRSSSSARHRASSCSPTCARSTRTRSDSARRSPPRSPHGVSRLVVGLGSSASTDGGTGMLRALGARFLDAAGADDRRSAARGSPRRDASTCRVSPRCPPGGVIVLTDVTNPLLGRRGAAAVFGPQKGADQAQVARLDAASPAWPGSSQPTPRPRVRVPRAAPASDCSRGARRSSPAHARSPN